LKKQIIISGILSIVFAAAYSFPAQGQTLPKTSNEIAEKTAEETQKETEEKPLEQNAEKPLPTTDDKAK